MNLLSKNIFQNVKKFGTKIPHVHFDILYLYTSFQKKITFFMPYIKKTNLCVNISLFTGHSLSFLPMPRKMFFVAKNLCTNIQCPDLHEKFIFRIFWHLKFVFYTFSIIGSYTPESQSTSFKKGMICLEVIDTDVMHAKSRRNANDDKFSSSNF
jgi:hypothetical protein